MKLEKSAPWIEMVSKFEKLFEYDAEISIEYDDNSKTLHLYVDNEEKADALTRLLPDSYELGNIALNVIIIYYPNGEPSRQKLFEKAFEDNPIVGEIMTGRNPITKDDVFVVFTPEIVQYHNDNLFDINGLKTTVYEEIARDVFNVPGVWFNTEKKVEVSEVRS